MNELAPPTDSEGEKYVPPRDNYERPLIADVIASPALGRGLEEVVMSIMHPEVFQLLGVQPDKTFLFDGPPGCLEGGTLLRTIDGLVPIKDVTSVLSWDGQNVVSIPCIVLKTEKESFLVEFDDGTSVVCSGEHPWFLDDFSLIKTENIKRETRILSFHESSPNGAGQPPMDNNRFRISKKPLLGGEESRRSIKDCGCGKARTKESPRIYWGENKGFQNTKFNGIENGTNERNKTTTNEWGEKPPICRREEGRTEKESKRILIDSETNKTMGVLILQKEEYERTFRLDSSSQRWKQQEQLSRQLGCVVPIVSFKSPRSEKKILAVKKLLQKKVMYDLIVPCTNNFILANGVLTHNTGKSFSVKAVRNELIKKGINGVYIPYSIGTFGTAYINMGAVNLQQFFSTGHALANEGRTVLYFFDEADVLMSHRTASAERTHKEDEKLLDTLMTSLQDIHDHGEREYVFFATNFPEGMDEAAVRAGRIDRVVRFELPGEQERRRAFVHYVEEIHGRAKYHVFQRLRYEELAAASDGFNYADIASVVEASVRRVAYNFLRDEKHLIVETPHVTMKDLQTVIGAHRGSRRDVKKESRRIGFV